MLGYNRMFQFIMENDVHFLCIAGYQSEYVEIIISSMWSFYNVICSQLLCLEYLFCSKIMKRVQQKFPLPGQTKLPFACLLLSKE